MKNHHTLLLAAGLQVLLAPTALGQDNTGLDIGRFAIAGYGDFSYTDVENQNSFFGGKIAPIFLFKLSDQIHVETELEFSIGEGGATETELEYSDIHFFATDTVTITAGKFLLPFGQFGPNLHPSWINKLPTTPGIYGHHEGESMSPMHAILPVLSDFGVAYQQTFSFGDNRRLFIDAFVTNGPRNEGAPEAPDPGGENIVSPEVSFEAEASDNNDNKAYGGRIGAVILPWMEWGFSYYDGAYDDEGELTYEAGNVDLSIQLKYFALRGEYVKVNEDVLVEDPLFPGIIEPETEKLDGWYVQGSWSARQLDIPSLNPVELVLRYDHTNHDGKADRWTVGIDYWFDPRSVAKVAFETIDADEGDSQTGLYIQFAYGF